MNQELNFYGEKDNITEALANSPLSTGKIRWYIAGTWLIWSLLIAVALMEWYGINHLTAISDSLISNSLLIISVSVIGNILIHYRPLKGKIIFAASLVLLLSLIVVKLDTVILSFIYGADDWQRWVKNAIPVRAGVAFLINGNAAVFGLLWYELQEQKASNERREETEKIARDAELYKLRQQLQPHFLFNSLNSINALIRSHPDEARRMVQQLSDFLRGTLKREENQFITLAEELEYLQLYLDIEKVRFGYRLRTTIASTEEALSWKIPPLLLQPLMENAIKFGLYGTTGETMIRLQVEVADHHLIVVIANPYDPEMQMPLGTGFGLKSVRRRLYLLFGRNDLVETSQTKEEFIVIFRIPYTHA